MLSATVGTDKLDYAPGETALITASNDDQVGVDFVAGETVTFRVSRTDGIEDYPRGNLPWSVTDGVGGFDAYYVDIDNDGAQDFGVLPDLDETVNAIVSTSWYVEDQYANSELRLTAVGQTSGAEATVEFTDSIQSISINSPTTASPHSISTAAASYTVPVSFAWTASATGTATVTATAKISDGTIHGRIPRPSTTRPQGRPPSTWSCRVRRRMVLTQSRFRRLARGPRRSRALKTVQWW